MNISKLFLKKTKQLINRSQYNLILHEYQTAELFKSYGLPLPTGRVVRTSDDAYKEADKIINEGTANFTDIVIKAQVHTGGRGKGYFKENGFRGGVQIANSADEAKLYADKMLNKTLITKQTGEQGKRCEFVYVVERTFLRREMYLSISLDRTRGGISILVSDKGGVNIEESDSTISNIQIELPNSAQELDENVYRQVASALKLGEKQYPQLRDILYKLMDIFITSDATLIEINPLGQTIKGDLVICDQKFNIDDNSEYRQGLLFQLEDHKQKDWKEVEAQKYGLNYIALDGNIGCMVNGAGLAMATMDLIKQYNGSPANFLDVGGKATDSEIVAALRIMDKDPKVEAILVNIFAGIARCDIIALGLIKGLSVLGMKKPMVLRLKGTNVDEARQLISDSGFNMIFTEDLDEAANKAVKMSAILRMAKEVSLNVNLTS